MKIIRAFAIIIVIGMFIGCAEKKLVTPNQSNFKTPSVTLESFEVPQYDGYWYYSKKIKPTKGQPGDRGAPLPMSFLFKIDNPNPYPIKLSDIKFTVNFEGFDLITPTNFDGYYIPANGSDHVRINTMITVRSALLSLLVTGGFKLKEKGWSPWQALERWWTKIPTMEIPVVVKDGAATFTVDGVEQVVAFEDKYPKE